MKLATVLLSCACPLFTAGCGGLLRSHEVPPTVYELHARPIERVTERVDATLMVSRPIGRPGFEGDRIPVRLPDRRLDSYAGGRFSGPLPRVVETLLVDGLRSAGGFRAVVGDRSEFSGRFLLQTEIVDFAAEYAAGGGPPVVHVTLRAELGTVGDRHLLASLEGSAVVTATADRQREVAAAFEAAAAEATTQLVGAVHAAAQSAQPTRP